MKIGIMQASSQKGKNKILEDCLRQAASDRDDEIINFGIYEESKDTMSYIEAAVCISLLLESGAVDFIVTGCSSGQGMMLALNSLPGVLCGYVENVTDAYLFGRINDGNAVSYPLGFQWGWAGEINLKETLKALFGEPFGQGYPKKDAERKIRDTKQLKAINRLSKKELTEILPLLEEKTLQTVLSYEPVYEYIKKHGTNERLNHCMEELQKKYRKKEAL